MVFIPQAMKAIVIRENGDATVLKYETDYPTPDPQSLPSDHVLVKNEYAGINFIDTYHRKGLYPRKLPFVAGQEGGGRIVAIQSSNATISFKIGDRVAYSAFGSYAQYTVVPITKFRSSQLLDWIQKETLHMSIDQVFKLENAIQGHLYLESGQSKGKLLFIIE
mmetsp:Transcript_24816/g.23848  ORF Transcript_24816/g.23848 Transcript_24816/m.23848 type:complete len:164 (-) Transcript_24816:143-634(-)|eukprot:CAMPEP_0197831558 /NCGR_PEP_ID=MMETSP1437-20131217/10764_1 /TAXON_ID=49252 ORGANISM="Eucampia antarctica, Strain CCMP1452" /NCGR_SAMPLE_ID=MMETSP1437 /ASSEMBLY_ACC=CAM_ASM_001096 /LENGTH=163 /DNA_ID=CAMNT_0043434523 /DNA_START=44 /DNA_END=535 /DNA_ORIENTATION=-